MFYMVLIVFYSLCIYSICISSLFTLYFVHFVFLFTLYFICFVFLTHRVLSYHRIRFVYYIFNTLSFIIKYVGDVPVFPNELLLQCFGGESFHLERNHTLRATSLYT